MSVEINEYDVIIGGHIEIKLGFLKSALSFSSCTGASLLSKQELAQLIAALQAMHDKMGNNE